MGETRAGVVRLCTHADNCPRAKNHPEAKNDHHPNGAECAGEGGVSAYKA